MNIAFVGSGNVAWNLAPELENAGHKVVEVVSKQAKNAKELVKRLYNAHVKTDLDFSESNINLIIICVADDALEDVAREIVLPDGCMVAHTSGSKPLAVLDYLPTDQTGVFYPLQTFSKAKKVDFRHVPFLIESDDKNTLSQLTALAKSIGASVKHVTSADRKALHIAAVFACNFTNHMLTISKKLLGEKGLDFELIKPLIIETMNKAMAIGPQNAQTGPARRFDTDLLEEHMTLLSDKPEIAAIYRMITQHIIDTYS